MCCCRRSRPRGWRCRRSRTARSTSMRIADAMPASIACSYSSARRWRQRRASTSARTARRTTCASPIPARWRISRRRRAESDGLLFPRLLPEELEPRALGKHLGGVLPAWLVERAGIHLQRSLGVVAAPLVFAQDLRADLDVHFGLEQRFLAAQIDKLVEVVLRHYLHQPLCADQALRDRVIARLDRHHGKDE